MRFLELPASFVCCLPHERRVLGVTALRTRTNTGLQIMKLIIENKESLFVLWHNNNVSLVCVYWLSYYLLLESATIEVGSSSLFSTKTSPLGSRLVVLAFLFDKKTLASDPLVLEFSFTNDRFKASITDFERCSWLPCKLLGSGQQKCNMKVVR